MKMSYYLRNRIFHHSVNVVMIFFLFLTLFPIGWMVFSSFKSNTEILLGQVPLGRHPNTVRAIHATKDRVWILTADGGINMVIRATGKLLEYKSLKTLATSYAVDGESIYLASADKGIWIIPKTYLGGARRINMPVLELDVNKVVSTSLLRSGDRLYLTYQHRDFEKIFEIDTERRELTRVIHLEGDASPFQIKTLTQAGSGLVVGTNKGLMLVNIASGKVASGKSFAEMGINANQITDLAALNDQVVIGTDSGAFVRTLPTFSGDVRYGIAQGLVDENISAIAVTPDEILLGSTVGLTRIDRAKKTVVTFENLFSHVNGSGLTLPFPQNKTPNDLESGSVLAIGVSGGGTAYVGTSAGRVSEINSTSGQLMPFAQARPGHLRVMWRNYIDLWKNIDFGLFLRNSLIVCGMTMVLAMIFSTLSAYALSRFTFPGSKAFSFSILATQMIPAIMLLIPIYTTFVKITMLTGIPIKGTFTGLIFVYSAFFIPFSIWILRGFFAAIPKELEEAARIDGCSAFQVFRLISLPLAIPGIIATGIYVFLTAWDELMFAWVLTSADTMTIPVGIRNYVGNYQNRFDLMMAAATIATVPVMILFFLLQRHIVKGLTAGAVKG